jgi:type VI secretion system protein ImpF
VKGESFLGKIHQALASPATPIREVPQPRFREEELARTKSEILITQSLVDRLVDQEQWPETRAASISMYRESLKRDLEWLLNTRQPVMPELESYPVTAASVLNFGFPDLHSFDGSPGREQNTLTAHLERSIRTFEPRISDPHVYLTRSDNLSRSLKFHIEGQVFYENMNEEIKFDTVLQLISGEYEVK